MQTSPKMAQHTAQARPSGGSPLLLCLLMFGLTATVVYRLGYERWTPINPRPTYTATATVIEKSQQASGDVRIPIEYTDGDRQRAEKVANALAQQYLSDRHLDWQQRTAKPIAKAQEATEAARRKLTDDEALLTELKQELANQGSRQSAVQPPKTPSAAENPAWIELNSHLQGLEQRREAMLLDRTPLHPAVQELQSRIDETKQQLQSVPRQTQGKAVAEPAVDEVAETTTRRASQLNALTAAVERSRETLQQAEGVERHVLRLQQAGPQYVVEGVEVVEIAPEPDYGRWRLWGTTLVAGALMALGVGSFSKGANVWPVVASVPEVHAAAGVAIVGMIPADDPMPDVVKHSRRQWRARRLLIALGLGLILACPVIVIWGVQGI